MENLSGQLIALLFVVAVMLFTPILFIALDFWAGIRKAKKRGEKIRSDKMKRTMDKLSRYYNGILAMLVVDGVQIAGFVFASIYFGWTAYTFPVFTLASVMFVAAVEIKSIYEPADAKEAKENADIKQLAIAIAEHKQDAKEIAEIIAQYITQSKKDEQGHSSEI